MIPLVGLLKDRVPAEARPWVHRGATSQDILDSALMLVGRAAAARILASLGDDRTRRCRRSPRRIATTSPPRAR